MIALRGAFVSLQKSYIAFNVYCLAFHSVRLYEYHTSFEQCCAPRFNSMSVVDRLSFLQPLAATVGTSFH
jgi:hypothetical protein